MMHRKTVVLSMIVALCASVLVLTAGQCGAQKPGANFFERLDANADGKLTKEELPEQMAEKIMEGDADGDGVVTKEEFEAAREKMRGRRGERHGQGGADLGAFFDRFDANEDGKLTKDELPERAADRIMKADADGDGAVTKEELEAAREKMGGGRGEGGPDVGAFFDRFDANEDGKLTKDELPERAAEHIMKADADGDGAVTKEELEAAREKMGGGRGEGGRDVGAFFDRFDANEDGKLTKDELPERAAEHIMKADADGDGAVTKEELEAAREKMGGQRGGDGERGGRGKRGGQGQGGHGVGALLDRFDANEDGKLTKDELPERAAEKIMQADADGDGAVTKEELEAAREKMGGQRGGDGERGRRGKGGKRGPNA